MYKIHNKFSITNILIGLYILVYIANGLFALPVGNFAVFVQPVLNGGEYWRLLTYSFLNVDIISLLFNIYFVYIIGNFVEEFIKPPRYILLYIISTLVAAGAFIALYYMSGSEGALTGANSFGFGLIGIVVGFGLIYPNRYYANAAKTLASNLFIYIVILLLLNPSPFFWIEYFGGFVGGILSALLFHLFAPDEEW